MVDDTSASGVSPDETFALVGDETRLGILRTLGAAGEPLAFSTLFERSEYDTTGNFSYHLEKLDGHFVTKTDDGCTLRQAGRRVVEAVVSGTVTDDPVLRRAPTERSCPFCSAPIEVGYEQERVEMYCTECPGIVRPEDPGDRSATEFGTLGAISLPPAGVQGRTPTELLDAADVWTNLDILAISAGVCPRCAGSVEHAVTVCEDHDASQGTCDRCGRRYAALFGFECATCHYAEDGIAIVCLLATTELLSFLTEHGANPLDPETLAPGSLANYGEELRSLDPLRVELTFTVDGATLTMTVDEDVSLVDVTRGRDTESA